MLRVAILIVSVALVSSHGNFMYEIPNGREVEHPCIPNLRWLAVGHNDRIDGNSGLNVFGEDFIRNNYQWDKELCMTDSDKDGKTNGEELGDPSCIWNNSGGRYVIIPLPGPKGHPGICEPVGSPVCSFQNYSCRTYR